MWIYRMSSLNNGRKNTVRSIRAALRDKKEAGIPEADVWYLQKINERRKGEENI